MPIDEMYSWMITEVDNDNSEEIEIEFASLLGLLWLTEAQ